MNREIKFRGKDINGDWEYGYIYENGSISQIMEPTTSYGFDGKERADYYINEVDPSTVGQFTGLYDKNGKEIYEGDILGVPHKNGIKQHFYRVVEYCSDGFYLIDNCHEGKYGDLLHREISLDGKYAGMAKTLRRFGCDYCVVGNIHDNPELLKGGKE